MAQNNHYRGRVWGNRPAYDAPGNKDAVAEQLQGSLQADKSHHPSHSALEVNKTEDSLPRKILPVPGVLPHLWHKHQPPPSPAREEETNQYPKKTHKTGKTGDASKTSEVSKTGEASNTGRASKPSKPSIPSTLGQKLPPLSQSFVPAKNSLSMSTNVGTAASGSQCLPVSSPASQERRPNPPAVQTPRDAGMTAWKSSPVRGENLNQQVGPDLVAYRAPRPNHNYSGSSHSLPSLPKDSRALDIDNHKDGNPPKQFKKDIRNEIAPEHILQDWGGTWIETGWGNEPQQINSILSSSSFLGSFILSWVEDIPDKVNTTFLHDRRGHPHWECDVDTDTGLLRKPVDFPATMIDLSQMSRETSWRQQNWTSSLLMRREDLRLNNPNKRRHHGPPGRGPPRGWADTPVALPISPLPRTDSNYRDTSEREPNPYAPTVPCHLRPAKKEDMEGVRAIYNLEVEKGTQALDTEPLALEHFVRILGITKELGMPFVVAVSGLALHSRHQRGPSSSYRGGAQQVLAFGYLAPWDLGLAWGMSGRSRMTARAHVYVHPEYRKKKLGHACLDKILSTASARYSTKLGCDFVNPNNDPVYKYPHNHERKYHSVCLCLFVKTQSPTPAADGPKESEDEKLVKWAGRYLKDNFRIEQVARFDAFHRGRLDRQNAQSIPEWYDMIIFRHICEVELDNTLS